MENQENKQADNFAKSFGFEMEDGLDAPTFSVLGLEGAKADAPALPSLVAGKAKPARPPQKTVPQKPRPAPIELQPSRTLAPPQAGPSSVSSGASKLPASTVAHPNKASPTANPREFRKRPRDGDAPTEGESNPETEEVDSGSKAATSSSSVAVAKKSTPVSSADPKTSSLSELLHKKLIRGLEKAVPGIKSLTSVQASAWGPLTAPNTDVLIRSETGSGKTLAYALPLMHQLLVDCDTTPIDRGTGLLILVLVPTRELALQAESVFNFLRTTAQFVVVGAIYGGEDKHKEKARLRKGIHILISTPGRMVDHLGTTASFKHDQLQTLVLDEADRLLDMGFERDIRRIVSETNVSRRRVLVSATITPAIERLSHFALRNPVLIGNTEDKFEIPSTLSQFYVEVPCKHRLETLIAFLLAQLVVYQKRKIIVFMSTADATEFHYMLLSRAENPFSRIRQGKIAAAKRARLANNSTHAVAPRKASKKLSQLANAHLGDDSAAPEDVVNFDEEDEDERKPGDAEKKAASGLDSVDALFKQNLFKLHGNMSQVDRSSVFSSFKACEFGVLFCTDVAARGLDMPSVDWVVHYDPPSDERCYIHRIGRTARIGNIGASLLFLMPHEKPYLEHLSKFTSRPIEEKKLDPILYHLSRMDRGQSDWLHSAGTLHRSLCVLVRNDELLLRVASYAYRGFIRAYAAFPRQVRHYFDVREVHLGHVAHAFAIDMTPAELERNAKLTSHVREERQLGRNAVKVGGKEGRGLEGRIQVRTDETYHSTLVQQQARRSQNFLAAKVAEGAYTKPVFTEFDA